MRELLFDQYILKIMETVKHTDVEIQKDDGMILRISFAPGIEDEEILQGARESLELVESLKEPRGKIQ